jgi:hypothetical protein
LEAELGGIRETDASKRHALVAASFASDSMSFAFLPRKVGQPSSQRTAKSVPLLSSTSTEARSSDLCLQSGDAGQNEPKPKGKAGAKPPSSVDEKDLARLSELALSDYAISHDDQLYQFIESSEDGCTSFRHLACPLLSQDYAVIPLSWLLNYSEVFKHLSSTPSLSVLAKSVRTHVPATLEVRVALTEPSKAAWKSLRLPTEDVGGGYEIRRVGSTTALSHLRELTEDHWDARTVYLVSLAFPCPSYMLIITQERIPHPHWSLPGIASFIDSLLHTTLGTTTPSCVQHVYLPPHHLDKPGSIPRCKGFALVTLSSPEQVKQLLKAWPWDIPEPAGNDGHHDGPTKEGLASGLRCLSKQDWDRLKDEYLAYRERLLAEMERASRPPVPLTVPERLISAERDDGGRPDSDDLPAEASFPPGCLLFVRNVHPQTNRTTLRTLLTKALGSQDIPTDAIDYVDYTKGMDTVSVCDVVSLETCR